MKLQSWQPTRLSLIGPQMMISTAKDSRIATIPRMPKMKPETISRALSEATDEQIKSEWAKRTQAMRKTKTGGRNGGRPKKAQ
jgi:hypothetical protein